ncbi:hypothetical protein [Nocardioides halotolerans]|uniref:hypothetical protein n=1 Tax=Nocardioides halotolerans TaxID=433660 RepID=UPI0004041BE7|nr:hypothetical protein [Nocardioides halotolerans]
MSYPASVELVQDEVALLVSDACPAGLRQLLSDGAVVLAIGSNSESSGLAGATGAAKNLHSALNRLARFGGIDATVGLPDRDALARDLRLRGDPLDAGIDLKTGRPLRATSLVDRLGPQLVIHLSTGSRRKLSDQTRSNPISDDISDTMWAHSVGLVVLHEGTRALRTVAGAGRIIGTLDALSQRTRTAPWVYFGDKQPPQPYGKAVRRRLIDIAEAGEDEVERLEHRSASGIQAMVGTRFHQGRVAFGANTTVPAGAQLAALRPAFGRGRPLHIAYLDEPGTRPEPAEVLSGWLAEDAIRGIADPVNQVELVVWFLHNFGRPGWGYEECADYFVANGYRTAGLLRGGKSPEEGYRRRTDDGHSMARNICWSILRHLDEYLAEKIVLRGLGMDDSDANGHGVAKDADDLETGTNRANLEIEGFRPANGPWLTVEDYDRIIAFLAVGSARHRNTAGYALSRWAVETPQGKGELVARAILGNVVYYIQDHATRRRLGTRDDPLPPLHHAIITASIVDGLANNVDALRPLLSMIANRYAADEARAAVLEAGIRRLQRKEAKYDEEYWEDMTGHARRKSAEQYNKIVDERVKLETELGQVQVRLRAAREPELRGIHVDDLLEFAKAMRDPTDVRFRAALIDGTIAFQLWTETRRRGRRGKERVLRWRGTIAVHDDTRTVTFDFEGEQSAGRSLQDREEERWREIYGKLAAGCSSVEVFGRSNHSEMLPLLRACLGIPEGRHYRLSGVTDPRIHRILVAMLHPPRPGSIEFHQGVPLLARGPLARRQLHALAKRLREPLNLLRHMHDLYVVAPPPRVPRWLRIRHRTLALTYHLADRTGWVSIDQMHPSDYHQIRAYLRAGPFADDWDIEPDGLRLRPCPHCGHQRRHPLRMIETQGAVCTLENCRKDRAGNIWAAIPYDRYRD